MVVGILWLEDSASHAQYSRARRRFPIQWGRDHGVNAVFERCNQRKTALPRQAWISDRTWKLVDLRVERKRNGNISQAECRELHRQIQKSFKQDRQQRMIAAGESIETALNGDDLIGAWAIAKRWYRFATGPPPKPMSADLEAITAEYEELGTPKPLPCLLYTSPSPRDS